MESLEATAVIPIPEGAEPNWQIPDDMRWISATYGEGERALAMDQMVDAVETETVLLFLHDALIEQPSLGMLLSLIWNVDAVYPSVVFMEGDEPKVYVQAPPFCRNRLKRGNRVGHIALVRKEAYRRVGGYGQGPHDLWMRLGEMKPVPEARVGMRSDPFDETVVGEYEPAKATFYAQATRPTTYYRCQLPSRYLPGLIQPDLAAAHENGDGFVFDNHEGQAVWQFPGDLGRAVQMDTMQRQGTPIWVDVDDSYLRRHTALERAGWVQKRGDPKSVHSIELHRILVKQADGVLTASRHLKDMYGKLNPNTHHLPNQIDPSDWPELEKPDDGVVRVGWFGSSSHRDDKTLVEAVLKRVTEMDNVEIVLMGVGADTVVVENDKGEVEKIGRQFWWAPETIRYQHIPVSNDLAVYYKMLYQLDIGLAPVLASHWADCRSDLKALEYAMAGAVPVLSKRPPYEDWTSGERCLKAGNGREFVEQVKRLVDDPALRTAMADEAREHVRTERTAEKNTYRWEEAFATVEDKYGTG